MEDRRHLLACLLFAGFLFMPFRAFAYSFTTHAFLTDATVDFYNESFPEGAIPDALKDFLADGAMHEESPPRLLNHFYDPVYGRGLVSAYVNGYASKEWAVDSAKQNEPRWKIAAAVTSILSAALKKNVEELSLETDFTWGRAKYFYLTGDVGKAMYLLGHVLHLVQDASVPAATRNDGASLVRPDPYELWTWRFTRLTPDKGLAERLGGKEPFVLDNLGVYFNGLATYSNNNFYSENTAGTGSDYKKPFSYTRKKEGNEWFRLARDNEFGIYHLIKEGAVDNSDYSIIGNFSIADDNRLIVQDYWRILSTKSVQYGAGVIDLFFREAEAERGKALKDTETGGQTLVGKIFSLLKDANRILDLGIGEEDGQTVVLLDREDSSLKLVTSDVTNLPEREACVFETSDTPSHAGLIINEVAWMGSTENYRDEWVELKNILGTPLRAGGYTLVDEGEQIRTALPDVTLRPGELLLLRRGADYEGTLGNNNEGLRLFDAVCGLADEVLAKPDWPAGDNDTKQTMERSAGFAWQTSAVPGGTPGAVNSVGMVLVKPEVSMSTTTVRRGEAVLERGEGFTPGRNAALHFGLPDGSEVVSQVRAEKDGTFEKMYTMPMSALFGDYLYYAIDETTGKKSNAVRYRVVDTTQAKTETITLSKSDPQTPPKPDSIASVQIPDPVSPPEPKCGYDGGGTPHHGTIVINEVAWMGTLASAQDEWIELKNISGSAVDLSGYELVDRAEQIHVVFGAVTIPAGGYVLLERTDDSSVPAVSADIIYTGALANTDEGLELFNASCTLRHRVAATPAWPGGDVGTRQTMERSGNGEWQTSAAPGGTPRVENSYGAVEHAPSTTGGGASGNGGSGQASGPQPDPDPEPVPMTGTPTGIVISEVMPGAGVGLADVEWVELYNSTDATVGLGGWSLRRRAARSATTSQILAMIPTSTIRAHGFYLIGSSEYSTSTERVTAPDTLYTTEHRLAYNDDAVLLVNRFGEVTDEVSYLSLEPGQSAERYAREDDSCHMPIGGYEFGGNGCPNEDIHVRGEPNPQCTASMCEPRATPAGIVPSFVYDPTTLSITGSWSPYVDAESEGTGITYVVTEGVGSDIWYNSTSLSFSHDVREVGRTYTLSFRAFDRDGLGSALSTSTLVAPSFFDALYVYPDPRSGGNGYLVDAYYENYPFIPDVYRGGAHDTWKGVVFSLNAPAVVQDILTMSGNWETDDADGVLHITYKRCNDSYGPRRTLILPDTMGRCSAEGGGLQPEGMSLSCIEDNHFIVGTASSTDTLSLTTDDYVMASFYSFSNMPGGEQQFRHAAADRTEYHIQNEPPTQVPPVMAGGLSAVLDRDTSLLAVSWDRATDADTPDTILTYEINFSPADGLNETLWMDAGEAARELLVYEKNVSSGDAFTLGVRAVDDFGDRSAAATLVWSYPPATFHITQTIEDGWSSNWGYTQTDLSHRQVASFQSFTPASNLLFNRAVMKVKCATVRYGGTSALRLSVYGADSPGNPDFASFLGDATLDAIENSSSVREVTFSFPTSIPVSEGNTYWLVLDVSTATSPSALYDNRWVNAIMRGGPAYEDGKAGRGVSRGTNDSCTGIACSFQGDYYDTGASDWYFKLGLE